MLNVPTIHLSVLGGILAVVSPTVGHTFGTTRVSRRRAAGASSVAKSGHKGIFGKPDRKNSGTRISCVSFLSLSTTAATGGTTGGAPLVIEGLVTVAAHVSASVPRHCLTNSKSSRKTTADLVKTLGTAAPSAGALNTSGRATVPP